MADLTVPQHDTWPPVRGNASDENGLMDLTTAESLKFIMKAGVLEISGSATVLQPPQTDASGNEFNWQYSWTTGDTDTVGTYEAELEITWDSGTTPPQVQTVPNGDPKEIEIRADVG